MQFEMAFTDACAVLAPLALFGLWVGVVFGCVTVATTLRRLPRVARAAFLTIVLLCGTSSPAFAGIPMPAHCQYMNDNQWPCPLIEALWCPCYWNSPPPPDGF